jgi:hypothetical protein
VVSEPPPRVEQDVEPPPVEEAPRVYAGTVTDPAPAPAVSPARPAPVRLPFTGASRDALPLAGAALALGGLAIAAGAGGGGAGGGEDARAAGVTGGPPDDASRDEPEADLRRHPPRAADSPHDDSCR